MSDYIPILVNGALIRMKFEDRVVRIANDANLRGLLDQNIKTALTVARKAKAEYRKRMGKQLDVSDKSMAIEIIGHVYPGRLCEAIDQLDLGPWVNPIVVAAIKALCKRIMKSTDVIDSGESSKDGNRWIWDALEVIYEELLRQMKSPVVLLPIPVR